MCEKILTVEMGDITILSVLSVYKLIFTSDIITLHVQKYKNSLLVTLL